MRIVVTGATGNVGSRVLQVLCAEPAVEEVVGLARRPPSTTVPKVRFVAADVASDDLAPIFEGADAVVHLAWLFQPTHDPLVTWRVNAEGSAMVFDAVGRARVPALVHASSVGAYSPGVGDDPVDETWPTHSLPTAGYGREKAYVERLLDTFEERHPETRVVRLRPAFIFQRAAASQQKRLFAGPLVPRLALRPGRLPILPIPSGLRFQSLHADDAADGYRRAVLGNARGAFNLAADPVIGPSELGQALRSRVVEVPAPVVRAGLAVAWHAHLVPVEPALFDLALRAPVLDSTRARNELGWRPRHSAVESLREALVGMGQGAGGDSPPLQPDRSGERIGEVLTGIGERP
jgi:nucleoside-diphosphate-sugar epimerase